MKNKIGVMQGRLLPKYKGNYQAHPLGYWKKEFKIARDIGLDNIEFILDFNEVSYIHLEYLWFHWFFYPPKPIQHNMPWQSLPPMLIICGMIATSKLIYWC